MRDATSPAELLELLRDAIRSRDGDLYARLLDDEFEYEDEQADCLSYGRDTEALRVCGPRDGSDTGGLFRVFRSIDYSFVALSEGYEEDFGTAEEDEGDHWYVYQGVSRYVLISDTATFFASQMVLLKMRENVHGLWRIVRWRDTASLPGESLPVQAVVTTWGHLKEHFAPPDSTP